MNTPLTILVVDDSSTFRKIVESSISDEKDFSIIGSVGSGQEALDFLKDNNPDIVTLDVEMPGIDGIETLKRIIDSGADHPEKKQPAVIMLSSHTKRNAEITIRALQIGAFDFVPKPLSDNRDENRETLRRSLLPKLYHIVSLRSLGKAITRKTEPQIPAGTKNIIEKSTEVLSTGRVRAIAIGVSTGGPRALMTLIPALCTVTNLPILIVQHMPEKFTASLAESLDKKSTHMVKEATAGESIEKNTIYIAPGGRHMVVHQDQNGTPTIAINDQPPENGCRPSVDVLYRSLPAVFGGDLIAIILTGMGSDGAKGLRPLKRLGAIILAQDEASSVVWGMPGSAVATGCVDQTLPLEEIPHAVKELLTNRHYTQRNIS